MKPQTATCRRIFGPIITLLASVVFLPSFVTGQTSTTARTPGSPAGSYKLGNADTVNLFTGNLNYNLPLLGIGGRGEAQGAVGIVIEGQWDLKETELEFPQGNVQHTYSFRTPNPLALVGSVSFDVSINQTSTPCGGTSGMFLSEYRAVMSYFEPDGTEHALRDTVVHGRSFFICPGAAQPLGRIFESTSSNFVTFINDTNMYSDCYGVSGCTNSVDGYLYFRNGTKSRVVAGQIRWTQDRNGNKISYIYETPQFSSLRQITDSIGRSIYIDYNVNDGEPFGLCTKLTFKGFGGQDRVIRISQYTNGEDIHRATQPYDSIREPIEYDDPNDSIVLAYGNLPGINGYVKAVWLPDGRSYKFKYNILGQLARVDLPTGGAIEYDFADIFQLPFPPLPGVVGWPTNRVSEKRIYDTNSTLLSKIVFSNPTSYTSGVIPPSRGGVVKDVELLDPNGNRLGKSRHFFYGSPNNLYGLVVPWWHGKEFRTETFDLNGSTLLRIAESDWRQRVPSWCSSVYPCNTNPNELAPTNNPFVIESKTTLVDGNLVSKVSAINPTDLSWAFDSYNNQTDVWEYDFDIGQPGNLVKHARTSYINHADPLGGIFLLGLTSTTSVFGVGNNLEETLTSSSQAVYDQYVQYELLNYTTVTGWQDPGGVRGNPTTVKRWLNTNNSWIEMHTQFDQLGNVRRSWDQLGRLSETSYADAFSDSENRNTFAFPTYSISPIPDTTNVHGSDAAFGSSVVYDYHSGLVKTSTDANGRTTTREYNDVLDRLKKVINPPGGGWTSFDYGDSVGNLYVKTTFTFDETRNLESYNYFDGLGRTVRSFAPKAGGAWIVADTQYDAAGRIRRVSKPYQGSSLTVEVNLANNWVTKQYDALGRITKITTADGSQVQSSYSANTITVTDADLKKRKTETDALGRLTQVIEDPGETNLVTNYKYDILGNLRRVEQGVQRRYFMYDSLSRLIRSRNPEEATNPGLALNDPIAENEQWSTSISYLANGDVSFKTDARGIKIEYLYDDLNRLYRRTYTPTSTPPAGTYSPTATVDYCYDGRGLTSVPADSLGKMTKVSSSVSETRYTSFDAMGRLKSSEQITDGVTYQMPSYNYNLAGALTSQTYPSGRIVQNSFDDAGSLSSVAGQALDQSVKTYASNFDYTFTDTGATRRVQLGNGRWESVVYNKRLQPTLIGLGTTQNATDMLRFEYGYGTTDNNGNVLSQIITVPTIGSATGFTATQTYTYDELNRLKTAQENSGSSWSQNFDYDRYGNRNFESGTTFPAVLNVTNNPIIDSNNNRIDIFASGQTNVAYDNAGSLTHDLAGHSFGYDGENKQATYDGGATTSGGASYFYDGHGRRVKKIEGGSPMITTVFVYNVAGQLVAEYSSTSPIAQGGTSYLTSDMLGSARIITGSSAEPNQGVRARHDYLPFGEELPTVYGGRTPQQGYVADNVRQKFTSYERDPETSLDYAQARYYSSTQGRFTSVDPLPASGLTLNPQTFNRYSYVFNRPLRYVDPSGLASQDPKDYKPEFKSCTVGVEPGCSETETVVGGVTIDISEYGPAPLETTSLSTTESLTLYTRQVASDTVLGAGKFGYNTVFGTSNMINGPIDFGLSFFTDFQFGQSQLYEASTPGEQSAMYGMFVGMIWTGGVGAAGGIAQTTTVTAAQTATVTNEVRSGIEVFRVFGGKATPFGNPAGGSFTIVNPNTLGTSYRHAAGLFPGNTGQFVLEGTLNSTRGVSFRTALPGPGGVGGTLPELIIPNAARNVTVTRVSGVNPPF